MAGTLLHLFIRIRARVYLCARACVCVWLVVAAANSSPSHEPRTPLEITDFMGHLRRLMKELYEAGFLF